MHRRDLLNKLTRYRPSNAADRASLVRIQSFVQQYRDCFERSLSAGHVTGSAWLLDAGGKRALLHHHRKLNKWIQLGGHADGQSDILAVALREACEESGLSQIRPVSNEIFDVDVHLIPAYGDEEEHFHYDVRFLLQVVGESSIQVSEESHSLAWLTAQEIRQRGGEMSVLRMVDKWQKVVA